MLTSGKLKAALVHSSALFQLRIASEGPGWFKWVKLRFMINILLQVQAAELYRAELLKALQSLNQKPKRRPINGITNLLVENPKIVSSKDVCVSC